MRAGDAQALIPSARHAIIDLSGASRPPEAALDLIKIYFVGLDKSHAALSVDQRAWLRYLTTDFTFSRRDDHMNQLNTQTPLYTIAESLQLTPAEREALLTTRS